MDDDLARLGNELAADESLLSLLGRFEMAWSPCLPMQLTWLTYRASKYLDRAHLIDRCNGGLDLECNLVPLCHRCHSVMPSSKVGQEGEALSWIKGGTVTQCLWQLATDTCETDGDRAISLFIEVMTKAVLQATSVVTSVG